MSTSATMSWSDKADDGTGDHSGNYESSRSPHVGEHHGRYERGAAPLGAGNPLLHGADDERRETLRRTLESLSSDQQQELMSVYRDCSREVALTRSFPFAGLVVASLYMAKKYLPPQLQFFGNRWPFYVATGMSALIVGQLLNFDKCNQRAKDYLYRISEQGPIERPAAVYQMEGEVRELPPRGELTYDDLREQNREQYRRQAAAARQPRPVEPSPSPRSSYSPSSYGGPPPPMSGTSSKTTTYGDEGFS